MKICLKCGKPEEYKAAYCGYCGTFLSELDNIDVDVVAENIKLRSSVDRLRKEISHLKNLNSGAQENTVELQEQLSYAEKCNLEFQAAFKKNMKAADPHDEVAAHWEATAKELSEELVSVKKALDIAKEAVESKDREIAQLKEDAISAVFCERLGHYCTPHEKVEWR